LPHRLPLPDSNPPSRALNLRARGPSAAALEVSGWCVDAARLVHWARRHGAGDVDTRALRGRLAADLVILVQDHAPIELEVTPRAIVLEDEAVFVAENANAPTGERALEHELPWVLHRDGIRALRFERGFEERESGAVLDALLAAAPASATHEDMVTLLWEAGLEHVSVRTEEFGPVSVNPLVLRQESGSVAHADDWPLTGAGVADVRRLWTELASEESAHLLAFHEAWAAERADAFPDDAESFITRMLAVDARPEMAGALAASVVTWIATCVQRSDWREAIRAGELLRRVDPGGRNGTEALAHAFGSVDTAAVIERLDECDAREQSRMFAFVVRVGAPALPLLIAAIASSGKARVRAGATTALAYAFADDPEPLARWLGDTRWHVVRNIVYVLGHIGGAEVVAQLAIAARNVDTRVRRAAIHALGQVPQELRRSVLLNQLDHADGRLVASALAILAREPDPLVTDALLARVRAVGFEGRPEDQKLALLSALADMGSEPAVSGLEEVLVHGGWFARRTPERTAAAHALARMGSAAARRVLETGLRHRSDAVRDACDEVLAQRGIRE
jgi:HEAT repeat protein